MSEGPKSPFAKKALADSVKREEAKLAIDQFIQRGIANDTMTESIKDDVAIQALSYAIEILYAKQGESNQLARNIAAKYPKKALRTERSIKQQLSVPTYAEMNEMDTDQIKTEVVKVVGQIVKVAKDIRGMGTEVAKFEKK
ncbi:uncharacterized protein MYCFIDRAFT_211170 [Pseudocercospora fijiensis CIRAD86]|uniref:Uncharacterized protein n=1 Tax=Pseudocercospora fijiensis (strain CIRAD86) TaxID=383855 RepID=M3B098_PSEFD|nr:uncharacterized protein MYCFIDRAFT_211170 [Pseudocercospora fijiensis CIRAD86]EME82833.1 hypothetical protein MYCFIDRAFT_211170 [Pseudocercospora fijiensis CIRAD86]